MKVFQTLLLAAGALAQKRHRTDKDQRIVGGVAANITNYPFIVKLQLELEGQSFLCAGSLLNEEWILTAAHCVSDDGGALFPPASTSAFAQWGGNNPQNTLGIDTWVAHPNYDAVNIVDDIALMQLSSPAPTAADPYALEFVKFAPYPLPADSIVRAIGWGMDETGAVQTFLREVDVHTISREECDVIRNDGDSIDGKTVCAGGGAIDEGKDACGGDSGGPLIWRRDSTSSWVQCGVVSYGYDPTGLAENCGEVGYWGVYGNPAYYVDWIESVTGISAESLLYPVCGTPPAAQQCISDNCSEELSQAQLADQLSNGGSCTEYQSLVDCAANCSIPAYYSCRAESCGGSPTPSPTPTPSPSPSPDGSSASIVAASLGMACLAFF